MILLGSGGTCAVLDGARLAWTGPATPGLDPAQVASVRAGVPLVPVVAEMWFGRPGLEGHRAGGRDWAPVFATVAVSGDASAVTVEAADERSGLRLRTEVEACPGGALRGRHTLTNTGPGSYVVGHLDVVWPVADRVTELLDFTGRWGRERTPQRRAVTDGLHLREGRAGKPYFDSPTVLVAGTAGFGFGHGLVYGLHVAWSGNATYAVERLPSGLCLLRGGELLLPGEVSLAEGEHYTTPWVMLAAARDGLDGLAAQWHGFARSGPNHPATSRPVVCNSWEATYFDHDLGRLSALVDRAAEAGAERFVLDDGWFGSRRDDTKGLGDWHVSAEAWPDGLGPLVERVTARGMEFGLWFEPEMVNPDSDLFRAHPDWILAIGDRPPREHRNQVVLDLGRPEVRDHLFERIDAVLRTYPVRYVKWDHNRALADAGSAPRGHAPGVRAATLGFYDLLDRLRAAHPGVEWESCSSGGGRIDLEVLTRVERFWTSDLTDALSRQEIQRWTGQLVPPEYLGSHVSAPVNHQTGRHLPLDFRAATALFGHFGIEWDLTAADPAQRARLAEWIALYKELRGLLHSGRVVRCDTTQPAVYGHGVLTPDAAVVAYVQLDEQAADPEPLVVPGLVPERVYLARHLLPDGPPWPGDGMRFTGAVLGEVGMPAPARRPQTITVVHLTAV